MFESVAPDVFVGRRSRFVFYESLPLSIGLHLIAVAVAATVFQWNVLFPEEPPRTILAYSIIDTPAPPPPPPAPVARPAETPVEQPLLPPKGQQVYAPELIAPSVIPETIVAEEQPVGTEPAPVHGPSAVGVENGGAEGGIGGGDMTGSGKGVVHGISGGIMGDDGRVHFARNAPLPMFSVTQPYPDYPEAERSLGYEDDVVVHYIIGTDGKVRDLRVLEHPKYKAFEAATLKAISIWQFRPLVVDGVTREVVHELLVRFRLEQ